VAVGSIGVVLRRFGVNLWIEGEEKRRPILEDYELDLYYLFTLSYVQTEKRCRRSYLPSR
jgi:hypothetical protein